MATSPAEAQAFKAKVAATSTPENVFKVQTKSGQGTVNNFPAQLGGRDPEDTKWQLYKDLQKTAPGQVLVGDDYFQYAARKEAMLEDVNFKKYILGNVSLDTPEQQQFWYTKFPWIKQMKLDELNRQAEIQKRLAKINLVGAEDEEDWFLLYQVAQKNIQMPTQPLTEIGKETGYQTDFRAGLFSPFRWLYTKDSGKSISYNNPLQMTDKLFPPPLYPNSTGSAAVDFKTSLTATQ